MAPLKATTALTPANPTDVPSVAVEVVEGFEGFSATVYPDPGTGGAPWTQGFGSTEDEHGQPFGPHSPPMTRQRAAGLLARDLAKAALYVGLHVLKAVNSNQRAALISLVYNIGVQAFLESTLIRDLNAGNFTAAAAQFLVWNRSGGQVMSGLGVRRKTEMRLFQTPVTAPKPPIPAKVAA